MDDKPWPSGALTLAWIPEQEVGGENNKRSDELRIRASNLELAGLEGLRPMAAKLSPALGNIWRATQPSGKIDVLALDIPLQATEKPASSPRGPIWPGNSGSCCQGQNISPVRSRAALKTGRSLLP